MWNDALIHTGNMYLVHEKRLRALGYLTGWFTHLSCWKRISQEEESSVLGYTSFTYSMVVSLLYQKCATLIY